MKILAFIYLMDCKILLKNAREANECMMLSKRDVEYHYKGNFQMVKYSKYSILLFIICYNKKKQKFI